MHLIVLSHQHLIMLYYYHTIWSYHIVLWSHRNIVLSRHHLTILSSYILVMSCMPFVLSYCLAITLYHPITFLWSYHLFVLSHHHIDILSSSFTSISYHLVILFCDQSEGARTAYFIPGHVGEGGPAATGSNPTFNLFFRKNRKCWFYVSFS